MRATVIRLVMALYPAPVRDRYGAELTDLLAHSTRPWRDAVDVGRCALADRAATWTWARSRPQLLRLAWLAAAPLGFGLAALVVAVGVVGIVTAWVEDGGYETAGAAPYAGRDASAIVRDGIAGNLSPAVSPAAFSVSILLSMLAVCGMIAALTLLVAPRHHLVAPVLTLPASLTVGILAIANLPIVGDVLGQTRSATVLSALCWCAAMLTLGVVITVLIRQGHTRIAVAVLVIGGLATLELTSALYASAARPAAADGVSAFSVWPLSIGGFADPSRISTDTLGSLPAMLTMCTTFALTRVAAIAVHQRKARFLKSQKPTTRSQHA
ncbi:hypothetical protein GCM10022251_75420 [Phytohabitans flavus]|uniref:Uncharacterized protein n=1 Tax=Phytohabitans flavus TaxID=1076124 RepID=A0A6F8XMD6_9ACTN|nr:hypothetical protein [Phytohabitans flavus]BCB74975.1 hypothetical protein Pflav_013850 [Phytohabitans flavus]